MQTGEQAFRGVAAPPAQGVLRVARASPAHVLRHRRALVQQATLSKKSENALLRERLQSKDALLQSKDQLLQSKDELLRAKDAQLAKEEELLSAVKKAATSQQRASRADLRRATEEATRTVEGVKLRGVVEYLAKTHGAQAGSQKGLDVLFGSDELVQLLLEAFSVEFKLMPSDLTRCVAGLYHTLSKELHGSESSCEVHEAFWRSPAERAVLCALLERFAVVYSYVVNDAVVPSPDAALALEVLDAAASPCMAAPAAQASSEQ
jgi:hypothetical protein